MRPLSYTILLSNELFTNYINFQRTIFMHRNGKYDKMNRRII